MHWWTGSAFGTGKGLSPVRCQDITWTIHAIADLLSIVPLGTNFSEISIRIQSFSFKNMRLKFSQRNFPSGDLLTYSTSRPIWYIRYVMRAKCWWPYLWHRTNSQCNRVWHYTLPHYAASRWLCYLFIAIPSSQGVPTNMIEISHLLLMASTECVHYGFCRRILPSALGRSCWYSRILLPSPALCSCRRDFDHVPLICRLWNALSTSCSSVHVYRFSTIFVTDRMWFGCMSVYSSWKRQLLVCESWFAEALELPLESFCVPTLHNPNVNMCPFAESSFWYQALQLFRILSSWQEILTNPTVDNLLYFEIVKVKVLLANGNTAQRSAFRTYHCAVDQS